MTGRSSPQNRPRRPRGGVDVQLYSLLNLGARWGGRSTPRPARFTAGKTRQPLYSRLAEPQDRSGRVRKISSPTGIRSKIWNSSVLGQYVLKDAVFRKALLIHFETNRRMMFRMTVAKCCRVFVLMAKQFRISVHQTLEHNVTESSARNNVRNHLIRYFRRHRNWAGLVTGD